MKITKRSGIYFVIFLFLFGSLAFVSAQIGFDNPSLPRVEAAIKVIKNFLDLSDTPSTYSGHGGECVRVKVSEDGLDLINCTTGSIITETDPVWSLNFTNMQADCPIRNYGYGFEGSGTQKCRADLDTNFTTECGDGEYGDGDGNCYNFNDSVKELLAKVQVIYNATLISVETGTLDSGNITSIQTFGDGDTYNVSEVSGAPGFLIYINFTNVFNFNILALRGMYDGGSGHTIDLELFRLSTQTWDDFGDITDQPSFGVTSFPIFIGSNFINTSVGNGTVQFRFNHDDNGISSHNYFLDAIFLGQITGLVSGGDHDDTLGRDNCATNHPNAMCADGRIRNFTGNVFGDPGVNLSFWGFLKGFAFNETKKGGDFRNDTKTTGISSTHVYNLTLSSTVGLSKVKISYCGFLQDLVGNAVWKIEIVDCNGDSLGHSWAGLGSLLEEVEIADDWCYFTFDTSPCQGNYGVTISEVSGFGGLTIASGEITTYVEGD